MPADRRAPHVGGRLDAEEARNRRRHVLDAGVGSASRRDAGSDEQVQPADVVVLGHDVGPHLVALRLGGGVVTRFELDEGAQHGLLAERTGQSLGEAQHPRHDRLAGRGVAQLGEGRAQLADRPRLGGGVEGLGRAQGDPVSAIDVRQPVREAVCAQPRAGREGAAKALPAVIRDHEQRDVRRQPREQSAELVIEQRVGFAPAVGVQAEAVAGRVRVLVDDERVVPVEVVEQREREIGAVPHALGVPRGVGDVGYAGPVAGLREVLGQHRGPRVALLGAHVPAADQHAAPRLLGRRLGDADHYSAQSGVVEPRPVRAAGVIGRHEVQDAVLAGRHAGAERRPRHRGLGHETRLESAAQAPLAQRREVRHHALGDQLVDQRPARPVHADDEQPPPARRACRPGELLGERPQGVAERHPPALRCWRRRVELGAEPGVEPHHVGCVRRARVTQLDGRSAPLAGRQLEVIDDDGRSGGNLAFEDEPRVAPFARDRDGDVRLVGPGPQRLGGAHREREPRARRHLDRQPAHAAARLAQPGGVSAARGLVQLPAGLGCRLAGDANALAVEPGRPAGRSRRIRSTRKQRQEQRRGQAGLASQPANRAPNRRRPRARVEIHDRGIVP